MPIQTSNTALCSEVVDALLSSSGVPTSYLAGASFASNQYVSLSNSTEIFANSYTSVSELTRQSIFQNLNSKVANYKNTDLNTVPACSDFSIDGVHKYPIVSFVDLRNIVIQAFIPLTNIRKCKFVTVDRNGSRKKSVTKVYEAGLLQRNAILANNSDIIANNQRNYSKLLITTLDEFLSHLSGNGTTYKNRINDLSNATISFNGEKLRILSAEQVYKMIDAVSAATDYLRKDLSCEFGAYDLQDDISVIYHNIGNNKTVNSGPMDPYTQDYQISNYMFGDLDGATFKGWNTMQNPSTVLYSPGQTIDLGTYTLNLWPKVETTKLVRYHSTITNSSIIGINTNLTSQTVNVGSAYLISAVGVRQNSMTPLYYINDDVKSLYGFMGYSTSKNSQTIAYTANQRMTMPNSDVDLWGIFKQSDEFLNKSQDNLLKVQNRFYSGYHGAGIWKTEADGCVGAPKKWRIGNEPWDDPYPVTITLSCLPYTKKLYFYFTGWINQVDHKHQTSAFVSVTVKDTSPPKYLIKDRFLFKYEQWGSGDSATYNEWSVHRRQDLKYSKWPETKPIAVNYDPSNYPGKKDLNFYFYVKDEINSSQANSGSLGVLSIKHISCDLIV